MSDECKDILGFLNCDYELFKNEKNGEVIVERWNELSKQGKSEGFFPLIIVASDILAETLEFIFEDFDVENTPEGIAKWRQETIAEAEKVDVQSFLAERLKEYTEMHKDDGIEAIWGEFKECQPDNSFYSHLHKTEPYQEIIIAKIPANNPWELAIWVPMGGFNDCPLPAEQAAVFKYWYQKYGAVPGVVTYDTWEFQLTKPPAGNEEAEALSEEHFAFCYDIIMQAGNGWNTVRSRASHLKGSTTWFFWWD